MMKAALMKGNFASGGVSLAVAFVTFVLLAMGLAELLICGVAAYTIDRELADITSADQRQRLKAINSSVVSFMHRQGSILQDHARFPLMTQAAMQPESYLERISDFMGTLSFLGKKYQLVLLDCYGETMSSTMSHPRFDYAQEPWVLNRQNETELYVCSVSQINESFFWRFATPILYGGLTQGFLVAEIPLAEIYEVPQLDDLLGNAQLEILYRGKAVSMAGVATGDVLESDVEATGLTLRYTRNAAKITAARNATILGILSLFSIWMVVTITIAAWIGRKVFVSPLEVLRDMTSVLTYEVEGAVVHKRSVIREINLLWADFGIMTEKIRTREQRLQKMNADLETRVQERTGALLKSHEELADAAQQWQETFDSAQDAILVYDKDLTVVKANHSAQILLDQTSRQLMGQSHTEVFRRCFRSDACPVRQMCEIRQHHEAEIQSFDEEKWLLSSADPILDQHGAFCGAVHFVRDITQDRKMRDELRQGHLRLELVLKGADLGMWDWDIRTGEVVFNRRWAEMLGYDLSEIEPHVRSWEKLVHPEDMSVTTRLLNAHLTGQSASYESEHRLRTKRNGWRWILDRGRVVEWDSAGKPSRMTGTHLDITEQKELVRKLVENESNLRSFFDSVENMVSVMDMQGTLIEVNKSLSTRLGYQAEELIGESILTLHPKEYCEEAKKVLQRMLEGQAKHCPLPLITKTGMCIPAETYVVKGIWSGQAVLFGVTKDISELRQSEERFSKAFHSSAALMAISTLEDGRFIEINECFLRTVGYTREEVIGKTSASLALFVDAEERETIMRAIHEQKRVRECELKVRTKTGGTRDVLFSADVLHLQDAAYLLSVANDVTELRGNQKKLHESERRLRALIETIPDLVWLKDVAGVYLACNPRFERFVGARETEITGMTDHDFIDQDLADSFRHSDQRAISEDRPVADEAELTYADDGHTELVEAIRAPVRNADGRLIGILGIARDITYRKQSEVALRRAHDTLEERVRDRTRQLQRSQHQLRELYSRLQSAQERDRRQISREIHDELGTVLTTLKYDVAWVKRKSDRLSAGVLEKLDAMSASIDSIIDSVQNICTNLRPGLLDDMGLSAAIEWQVAKLSRTAGFAYEADLDEGVEIDRDSSTVMFRVFQELMTNILRHAKADRVLVGLKQQAEEVVLTVRDNGIGITDEQIRDSGALGLIGIRERVAIYNGTFKITGVPGKGSTATVTIRDNKEVLGQ